jgi:long-chain-fatty-acid--[acyl-carrier-protein] ligase
MAQLKDKIRIWGIQLVSWFLRLCFTLRYKIKVVGLEKILQAQGKKEGMLFLPNHPAEIDPVLLMLLLWRKFKPRPMIVEHFYYLKTFHFFMKIVRPLPLPTLDVVTNAWKAKQIEKLMNQIKKGLENGENFIVYPSGKLKLSGAEALGGASFVHTLLKAAPNSTVVLVRTTGLWGSLFSRALTGKSPDFGKTVIQGFKILLKNGIFFAPRREVKIEFSFAPADLPITRTRMEFNRFLEQWYNRYPEPGPEPLSLVSFSFWKKELPKVITPEARKNEQKLVIPPKMEKEILSQLSELARMPQEKIQREANLSYDLGLDSLDLTQLYLFLGEKYGVDEVAPEQIQTVEDLFQAAAGAHKEKEERERKKEILWPEEPGRPDPMFALGSTLAEAFLLMADRMEKRVACADALAGILTYPQMKKAALVLSEKIRKLPGEKIGIMLPSSCAAYLLILATLFAKKIPVMLNWTAGVRSLEYSAKVSDLQVVISSMKFLGGKDVGDLGAVDEKILLFEDLRFSLTLREKIAGALLAYQHGKTLVRTLDLDKISKDDTAVILFTSGTESLPKGVPLTHDNLLSNQRAAMTRIDLKAHDLLYGVLPPFHSFGFSVTGLLPLLSGIKVLYAPDPTDPHALAHDIKHYKPTLFCCPPSFIKALTRAAHPEDLKSISYFVSGAERAPQELFDYVENLGPGHAMIEGYGITECGPIVTMTPLKGARKGVGPPLPDVHVMIVGEDTRQPMPVGSEGEIAISGPNVFHGYLGDRPSPFIQADGRTWYLSGDRGYLDTDGNLFISGRLKRFIKIGGEMISLGGLEEELIRLVREKKWTPVKEDGPLLAVAVREKESEKPLLVLVTTFEIDKEQVNLALKESGFAKLVKISEVKKVPEIPLTGTGKTHYRLLDELIAPSK